MANKSLILDYRKPYIIIWLKPGDEPFYYYSCVTGFYMDYKVGCMNQYGHICILIIELDFTNLVKYSSIDRLLYKCYRKLGR